MVNVCLPSHLRGLGMPLKMVYSLEKPASWHISINTGHFPEAFPHSWKSLQFILPRKSSRQRELLKPQQPQWKAEPPPIPSQALTGVTSQLHPGARRETGYLAAVVRHLGKQGALLPPWTKGDRLPSPIMLPHDGLWLGGISLPLWLLWQGHSHPSHVLCVDFRWEIHSVSPPWRHTGMYSQGLKKTDSCLLK